jgi:hypothetical protein
MSKLGLKLAFSLATVSLFSVTVLNPISACEKPKYECNSRTSIFCDNFTGRTFYKDEHRWADWYRFHDGDRPASYYDSLSKTLRLRVQNTTEGTYSDSEVALTELYKDNAYLLYGENTRVDIRMRFSPNMKPEMANPGTAQGTAGFLFWNYYKGTKDPINGIFDPVRDAFGFTWASETAPGLFIFKSVDSNVIMTPMEAVVPGININEFHTYSIERRHESIKFYIDGVLVDQLAVNGSTGLNLPADHKFTVDFWADNASYFFNADGSIKSVFWHIEDAQWLETDFVSITRIR